MSGLSFLKGYTHEKLRLCYAWILAESTTYPNPNDPENYTTIVIRWSCAVLWLESCNRCAAIIRSRDDGREIHNRFHARQVEF